MRERESARSVYNFRRTLRAPAALRCSLHWNALGSGDAGDAGDAAAAVPWVSTSSRPDLGNGCSRRSSLWTQR